MYVVPLLLLGLVVIVQSVKPVFNEEIQELIDMIHKDCIEFSGTTEEDVANCDKGIFKEDNKLKCYIFCLYEEANLVEDDLSVDYELLFSVLPEPFGSGLKDGIEKCKEFDTLDKDKCDRAFDVHKCLYEVNPKVYFIL